MKDKPYQGTNIVKDQKKIWKYEDKQRKENKKKHVNPFAVFGYGITAYFELMRDLIFVYMAMSVFAYGIINVYTNSHSLQSDS